MSIALPPPPHLPRRGYESLNVDTELRDGDVMTLVLKNPQDYYGSLGTEYGAKTYNPVVPQTDAGISKFFSILKFIVSDGFRKFKIIHMAPEWISNLIASPTCSLLCAFQTL